MQHNSALLPITSKHADVIDKRRAMANMLNEFLAGIISHYCLSFNLDDYTWEFVDLLCSEVRSVSTEFIVLLGLSQVKSRAR